MTLLRDLLGEKQGDFREFCKKNIVLDNGQPYDPYGRPCMKEITDNLFLHPHMATEKGEQTGFSTLFIAYCAYLVDQMKRNTIYFLPTDEFVSLFTPTRFDPTFERSPYLKSRLQNLDNKNSKQIGANFLYIRGLKSKTGAISVPADVIVYDEVALTDKANMELAEGRIAASDLAWRRWFSAPLFEEDNIDEIFQQSDQRHWVITCSNCRREQIAEENFPDCLVKPAGQRAVVACYHCGKPLDVGLGTWVAKHSERLERLGYRVPQLIIPGMNLDLAYDRTQEALRRPSKMAQVMRSVCGIPAAGNMQPIGDTVIRRVSEAEPFYLQTHSERPTWMGIDMGDICHIAIRQLDGNQRGRWIWFQEVPESDLVALVIQLEQRYNVRGTVIDAMPYKPSSKKVVKVLKNWAAIHYFRGSELKETEEGEGAQEVTVVLSEREDSIDAMVDELVAEPPLAFLPQPRDAQQEIVLKSVHRQLKKLVREERQTANGKILAYKDGVENHYGLAMTYACLAQTMHRDVGPINYESALSRRTGGFTKGAY